MQGCARRGSALGRGASSAASAIVAGGVMPPLATARSSSLRTSSLQRMGAASVGNVPEGPQKAGIHALVDLGRQSSRPVSEEATESDMQEEASGGGLTVASLKHVRRQRDKLIEEKARLEKDLTAVQRQLLEQRECMAALEAEAVEARAREVSLREAFRQAQDSEHIQRQRAIEAERLSAESEGSLTQREAELTQRKEALESQRQLTRDVCEASSVASPSNKQADLLAEKAALETRLELGHLELEELRRTAAEKAWAAQQHLEALKASLLSDAVNQKVELHISVPRVTLSYNNAPPLFISAAAAFGESRIQDLLEKEVFPHFEPLWARMDSLDKAPDGSTKCEYSNRMLGKLTEAVKRFVARSQQDVNTNTVA